VDGLLRTKKHTTKYLLQHLEWPVLSPLLMITLTLPLPPLQNDYCLNSQTNICIRFIPGKWTLEASGLQDKCPF